MDERVPEWLELAALPLAGVVVAIHLWWGIQRLVRRYLMAGVFIDPRPALFVGSSFVIVMGVAYLALGGRRRRPLYAAGIGLMTTYVVGYYLWHQTGHRRLLPWVEGGGGSTHQLSLLEFVIAHAQSDTLAMLSKGAELLLLVVLVALLYVGPPTLTADDRDEANDLDGRDTSESQSDDA